MGDSPRHAYPDVLVAEWTFNCVGRQQPTGFDGVTIAIPDSGKICELREYVTTAALYDWVRGPISSPYGGRREAALEQRDGTLALRGKFAFWRLATRLADAQHWG
jgi:hypothetical protein